MQIFSLPYIKGSLICLVCDTVPNFISKEHLSTVHEVLDHVLTGCLKCDWVDQIDVDIFVSCDLDSLITFDPVNGICTII